jgi:RimJ/RimL family protein N-acetyltransferase
MSTGMKTERNAATLCWVSVKKEIGCESVSFPFGQGVLNGRMSELINQGLPFPVGLRGEGLRLRSWRPGDEAAVLRGLCDAEFLRWNTPVVPVRTEADAARFIRGRAEGWERGTMAHFCVTGDTAEGTEGPVLGHVGLNVIDPRMRTGRVGYWVLPEARGHGVARRALELASRWAFRETGLHRLELGHALGHGASCRIAERCGFPLEGTLREAMFEAGRQDAFRHLHLHARLATDPAPAGPAEAGAQGQSSSLTQEFPSRR